LEAATFTVKKLPRRKLFLTAPLIVKNSCVDSKIDLSWDMIEQEKIELQMGIKARNGWLPSSIPLLPIKRKESFICFLQRQGIL
jgi:hypothetical protein